MSAGIALAALLVIVLLVDDIRLRLRLHRQADKVIDQTVEMQELADHALDLDEQLCKAQARLTARPRTPQGRAS